MTGKTDLVRSYFEAYRTGDRSVVEAALAQDFTFTSPYDDAIDRNAYFERCWPSSDLFRSIEVERICEQGGDVFVLYRCETRDGNAFRNMELHRFRGDRLLGVEVFFGATRKDGVFAPQRR